MMSGSLFFAIILMFSITREKEPATCVIFSYVLLETLFKVISIE